MKAQVVHIEDCFDSLRHFHIDAAVINKNAGIDEVRLALDLAATQRRQDAVWLNQANPCLRQANSISIPKRKLSADKIRIVKDRVETISFTVSWILITLRPEKRSAKSQVVMIDRRLNCGHVRTDKHRPSGNRISIVTAKAVVVRVRQIQSSQVTIAIDSNVANLDSVRPHVANQRRPHQKSIPIEFAAA